MRIFVATHPVAAGVIVGCLVLGIPHALLPDSVSVLAAALTLTFIAGIYVGFAILEGSETAFSVELVVAVAYAVFALLGLLISRWFVVAALLAHAAWDYAHHNRHPALTEPPGWYIPFCMVTDCVLAVSLTLIWLVG